MKNNMTYELAKQLKDAGFPQEFINGSLYYNEPGNHRDVFMFAGAGVHKNNPDWTKIPTLEELIDECQDGKHTFELTWSAVTKKWTAGIWYPAKQCEHHVSCQCAGIGKFIRAEWYSTRKEAVARLWLELNKHETQP